VRETETRVKQPSAPALSLPETPSALSPWQLRPNDHSIALHAQTSPARLHPGPALPPAAGPRKPRPATPDRSPAANGQTTSARTADRALWVILSRICRDWRRHLVVVQPDTVIRWHRLGWRLYWRQKSRARRVGRPIAEPEVRTLIRRLSQQNPLWGAPRIHDELLKLGFEIVEATVARYMIKRPGPPSQSWRTFVRNHLTEIVAIDFFTVPTLGCS
jgi:hypothetical protein